MHLNNIEQWEEIKKIVECKKEIFKDMTLNYVAKTIGNAGNIEKFEKNLSSMERKQISKFEEYIAYSHPLCAKYGIDYALLSSGKLKFAAMRRVNKGFFD